MGGWVGGWVGGWLGGWVGEPVDDRWTAGQDPPGTHSVHSPLARPSVVFTADYGPRPLASESVACRRLHRVAPGAPFPLLPNHRPALRPQGTGAPWGSSPFTKHQASHVLPPGCLTHRDFRDTPNCVPPGPCLCPRAACVPSAAERDCRGAAAWRPWPWRLGTCVAPVASVGALSRKCLKTTAVLV